MLMVKLKENVFGFTYDSEYGNVQKIFTQHLTKKEIKAFNEETQDVDSFWERIYKEN